MYNATRFRQTFQHYSDILQVFTNSWTRYSCICNRQMDKNKLIYCSLIRCILLINFLNRMRTLIFILMPAGVRGLHNLEINVPNAVLVGETVTLECSWHLEDEEALYSVKWYRGREEFYRYIPKELPHTRVFPLPGIEVDVSTYISFICLKGFKGSLINFNVSTFRFITRINRVIKRK